MLTKQQLETRRGRLGGSDAAAIVGKDPHKTAYAVALRITGQSEPDELAGLDYIEIGNLMEPVIAGLYERKNGATLYSPETRVHPKYPFLIANIDRLRKDRPEIGVEIKSVGAFNKEDWGREGSDEIPERTLLQCAHYFMVCEELKEFHVPRIVGGSAYQMFTVPRNQRLVEALEQIEVTFYNEVMAGRLPSPDWFHASTSDTIRRAFRKIDGTITEMPELAHWTQSFEEARAARLELEKLETSLHCRIQFLMKNAEVALLPDGRKWVRKLIKRQGYTVGPTEFIDTRLVKPKAKMEEE
jgi:putative phage-type endonuclease